MSLEVKIEIENEPSHEDIFNPWLVDSIQAFWFLKCPECVFDTKEADSFQEHAVENHPSSVEFFEKRRISKENHPLSVAFFENDETFKEEITVTPDTPDFNILNPSKVNKQNISDHKIKESILKCKFCDYNPPCQAVLERHIAGVHEGKRPFKCEICDHNFSRKPDLNKHIASVHEKKKPFKCELCGNHYASKFCLKQHTESIHEQKTFSCESCGSSYR